MNAKKVIIIGGLAISTILPFSSNGQTKKESITNKANKELTTVMSREITDQNGKKILITESHKEVINMPVKKIQEKYKENFESIFMSHILAEINIIRDSLGLKPLVRDHLLTKISTNFSKYLAENQSRGHELNGKTGFNLSEKEREKYKLIRENVTCESQNVTIFEIIRNWHYLDDIRDTERGQKREKRKNHKYLIIGDDIERFGGGITIDSKNKDIYVVTKGGSLF